MEPFGIVHDSERNSRFKFTKEVLGEGGFGQVLKFIDVSEGEHVAIKVTDIERREGLQSILELSIMATYNYPYLNRAREIFSDNDYTYIVQDMALCDLRERTLQKGRGADLPLITMDQIKLWCYQVSLAVNYLHQERIIHCDIKPSNILCFSDHLAKLADFTLSVYKYSSRVTFRHSTCTLTYRAPELFLELPWDESMDIWSLGCTFYEIFTGKSLIPYQKHKIPKNYNEDMYHRELKIRTYQAILEWRCRIGDPDARPSGYPLDRIVPVTYPECWYRLETDVKDLIIRMTSIQPARRPKISEVLQSSIFSGLSDKTPLWARAPPVTVLDPGLKTSIDRILRRLTDNQFIIAFSKVLYSRIVEYKPTRDQAEILIRIESCFRIASKIIDGQAPRINKSPLHSILERERDICEYLGYCVHFISKEDLRLNHDEVRRN